jgi:hypothetical protein
MQMVVWIVFPGVIDKAWVERCCGVVVVINVIGFFG